MFKMFSNDFYKFTLGCLGVVVKGFDLGIGSMKKGEKAVLTFQPDYAYGASGSPPNIPPNATLIFEVRCSYYAMIPKMHAIVWLIDFNFRLNY